jgi:antitoxin MazE
MKSKVIKIGNAKGIRLPKAILEEVGLGEEVILEASRGGIVIRPSKKIRDGWEAGFREMSQRGDDQLLDAETKTSSWDDQDWEWK